MAFFLGFWASQTGFVTFYKYSLNFNNLPLFPQCMSQETILAPRLRQGATIGIIAPSKHVGEERLGRLRDFEHYAALSGWNVVRSQNLFKVDPYGISAGTPEERASDINSMFLDDRIDAVWCFQGGDTVNQTLDLIDYAAIRSHPKILIGLSDIDVLLLAVYARTGLVTFNGCDPKIGENTSMDIPYNQRWFQKRFFERSSQVEQTIERACLREGVAQGRLIGCNIESMVKLLGTSYAPDFSGAILFFESYKSWGAQVISQMAQLDLFGVLGQLSGIVVGNNFGFDGGRRNISPELIIRDLTQKYQFPVLKINEFGHYQPHAFLPIGAQVRLDAKEKTVELCSDFLR